MKTEFPRLVETLVRGGVDFVVIGGVAVVAHGHPRLTQDLDICYSRERANIERLAEALKPLHPYLRGAPDGLPFTLDSATLRAGLNFTLRTDAGDLDLLGEVAGVGGYRDLAPRAISMTLFGNEIKVMSLEDLERAKRAAGRPQDLFDLEAIRIIRRRE